jgi:hypothetical protein
VISTAGTTGQRVGAGDSRTIDGPGWSAGPTVIQRVCLHVVADVEAEGVAIEGQGCVRVVVPALGPANCHVHGSHANCGSLTGASRFLIGLITCFATHGGIPAVARVASRRYVLGGTPTNSVKRS